MQTHAIATAPPWLRKVKLALDEAFLPPGQQHRRLAVPNFFGAVAGTCVQVPNKAGTGMTYGLFAIPKGDPRLVQCLYNPATIVPTPLNCVTFTDSACKLPEGHQSPPGPSAYYFQQFWPVDSLWTKAAFAALRPDKPSTTAAPIPPTTNVPPKPTTSNSNTPAPPTPTTSQPEVPSATGAATPPPLPPPVPVISDAPTTTSRPSTASTEPSVSTPVQTSTLTPKTPAPANSPPLAAADGERQSPTVFVNVTSSWACCLSTQTLQFTPARVLQSAPFTEACLARALPLSDDTSCVQFETVDECTAYLQGQPPCLFDNTCQVRVKIVTPNVSVPLPELLPTPPSSSMLTWSLVVILALSVAAIQVAYCHFLRRRRHRRNIQEDTYSGVVYTERRIDWNYHQGDSFQMYQDLDGVSPWSPIDLLDFGELPLWRLDVTHLLVTKVLSIGAHGLVAKGDYKGRAVAIKKLRPSTHPESNLVAVQTFVEEIKLLSQLESPYIVSLVGVCWDDPRDVVAVMDYMLRGDLRTFLQRTPPDMFPWTQKIDCAGDMCHGLVYLHSLDVMHRDLKSRNVLLNADLVAKLSDFGLSRHVDADDAHGVVGSFRYAAPEVLAGHAYTEAADMFALGMLLWELDVQEVPFAGLQRRHGWSAMALYEHLCSGELDWLEVSGSCPGPVIELIRACTAVDPSLRPTAVALADVLDDLRLTKFLS